MLNSTIKNKISNLWDMFWAAGTANPLTALEQISYLLFMRRAEDVGLVQEDIHKWSFYTALKDTDLPSYMKGVFEYLTSQNNSHEPFMKAMSGAKFEIVKSSLLQAAIDVINDIYAEAEKERNEGQYFQDTLGDFYELILSQTGEAGKNGQFRTPRHLIHFMCELLKPTIKDKICDVTCGTSGFLVGAYQYIITQNSSKEKGQIDSDGFLVKTSASDIQPNSSEVNKLTTKTFYGYDIDTTMIRLGMMNLMMHNIKEPHIKHIDSISERFDEEEIDVQYTKILANPPFTGRIDSLETSLSLNRVYPPKFDKSGKRQKQNIQSELLFLERIIQLLEINGKAAVIVPEGVLFKSSRAYKNLREILLKDCSIEAVISLPNGVFKPYAGVKTSILVFTKKGFGLEEYSTQEVWFYNLETDGYSLDENRKKLNDNPLPRAVEFFNNRSRDKNKEERKKKFYVSLTEIQKNDFNLSFNHYKDLIDEEVDYAPPSEILKTILALEDEIKNDLQDLKNLIGGMNLGNYINITTGKLNANAHEEDGVYPFFTCARKISRINSYAFNGEYVLIAGNGDLNVKYYNGKFNAYQRTYVIETVNNSVLSNKFLYYFLDNYLDTLRKNAIGGVIKYIKLEHLTNIKIDIPSLEEQNYIITVLDKLELLICKRKNINKNQSNLIKSLFYYNFKFFFSYGSIPLIEYTEIISGITKGKNNKNKEVFETPYLRVANVQDGYFDLSEIKTIPATETEIKKYSLLYNDLLLTEGGDPDKLGRGYVWRNEINGCIFQNHLFRVRIKDNNKLSAIFLTYLIASAYGKAYFLKSARQTTGIATINLSHIENFPLFVPPIEQQEQFSKQVLKLENLILKNYEEITALETLLKVLSKLAFEGKLNKNVAVNLETLLLYDYEYFKEHCNKNIIQLLLDRLDKNVFNEKKFNDMETYDKAKNIALNLLSDKKIVQIFDKSNRTLKLILK